MINNRFPLITIYDYVRATVYVESSMREQCKTLPGSSLRLSTHTNSHSIRTITIIFFLKRVIENDNFPGAIREREAWSRRGHSAIARNVDRAISSCGRDATAAYLVPDVDGFSPVFLSLLCSLRFCVEVIISEC